MDERVRLKDGDTGTFGMGKQSMLVRGPVAEDAAANISAWPVRAKPLLACLRRVVARPRG